MAASASSVRSPPLPTSLSLGNTHQTSQSPTQPLSLPQGACNFRELSVGHSCGCRRFCVNDIPYNQDNENIANGIPSFGSAWCFCGHHACFHELERDVATQRSFIIDDKRDILPNLSLQHGSGGLARQHSAPISTRRQSGSSTAGVDLFANNTLYRQRASTELPRSILPYPNSQNLPSTQSSFKLPSDISARSSGPQRMSSRPLSDTDFAGARICPPFHHTLPFLPPQADEAARSATEIATPSSSSNAESQVLEQADSAFQAVALQLGRLDGALTTLDGGSFRVGGYPARSPPKSQTGPGESKQITQELMSHIASLRAILLNIPNFRTSFTGLSQRLDALENMSFGHGSLEEFQDRHEHFDGRLLDVEGKVDELERVLDGILARYATRLLSEEGFDEGGNGSSAERSSLSNASSVSEAQSTCNSEVLARLDTIDKRLSRFEASAPPTINSPWTVEIVLLPWGRQLRGLWWFSALDFSQASRNHVDTQDAPDWHDHNQKAWMFPRACGPTPGTFGRIYERLASRGFVRNITVTSNSARHIEFEIMWAFGDLLQTLSHGEGSDFDFQPRERHHLGLRNPFIPLRKVHKSSQLRFLDPAELSTPSLWTADFLNSSILMKAPMAGLRRLFITTPSAYLQRDAIDGWNWQRLRELPRLRSDTRDVLESNFVGEADAMESCWNSDERLDVPISAKSSSASSTSSKSAFGSSFASPPPSPREIFASQSPAPSSHHDQHENLEQEPNLLSSSNPVEKLAPITPISEYLVPGMQANRTQRRASIPVNSTEIPSSSISSSKRPMSAADENTSSSIPTMPWKRRRLSKSPAGDGIRDFNWALTPRLSREPPSPGWLQQYQRPAVHSRHGFENEIDPVLFETVRKRGVTPSAYATPYSNTLAEQVGGDTDVDGDDESVSVEDVDLASEGAQDLGEEDEAWEGLIEEDEEEEVDQEDDEV